MEVLIGFAVGYLVGTRQGRQGLQNTLGTAQAILAHPETQKLVKQGIGMAEPMLNQRGRGKDRGLSVLRSVVEEFIDRRNTEAA